MTESSFQFTNPILERITFEVNKEFDKNKQDGIPIEINVETKRIEEKMALSKLRLKIGGRDAKAPFFVDGILSAEFSWKDDISEELVTKLLKRNTAVMLISYFRPIVANITMQAGLPPFHIPFINVDN
ncbi:protein-export chaperone SecB [Bariatricus sp. SGI.154]|uniref:protein-export chaperone SecB n=1 Tax=Bariatricus sp. SGI.154 TaxID=3420549 RepID=UPI003D06E69A